jgi:hypothetical protein
MLALPAELYGVLVYALAAATKLVAAGLTSAFARAGQRRIRYVKSCSLSRIYAAQRS